MKIVFKLNHGWMIEGSEFFSVKTLTHQGAYEVNMRYKHIIVLTTTVFYQ